MENNQQLEELKSIIEKATHNHGQSYDEFVATLKFALQEELPSQSNSNLCIRIPRTLNFTNLDQLSSVTKLNNNEISRAIKYGLLKVNNGFVKIDFNYATISRRRAILLISVVFTTLILLNLYLIHSSTALGFLFATAFTLNYLIGKGIKKLLKLSFLVYSVHEKLMPFKPVEFNNSYA